MSHLKGTYSEVQSQNLDTHEARFEGEGFGYHSQYHYAANPRDFRYDDGNSPAARGSRGQYKPTALRWPFLLALLGALLTTLAFLGYALASLPKVGSGDASGHVEARAVIKLDSILTTTTSSTYGSTTPAWLKPRTESDDIGTGSATAADTPTSTETPTFHESRDPSDYGKIGTKTVSEAPPDTPTPTITEEKVPKDISTSSEEPTTPPQSRPPSDYGKIGSKTVTELLPDTPTPTITSSETPTFHSSRDSSEYGKIGTKTVSVAPPDTPTPTVTEEKGPEDSTSIETLTADETRYTGDYGRVGTKTVTESHSATESSDPIGGVGGKTGGGRPKSSIIQIETVTQVTLGVTTITDSKGSPVATSTNTLSLVSSLQTTTLTNADGLVTATQVATVIVTPSVSVQTDSEGNPTATVVSYPTVVPVRTAVYVIDGGHYFMGSFLPTLVASVLAIAVRILDTNAKAFQPWHALTHERGASGRDSLCLETCGWRSMAMGLHSLVGGQAVVFLSSLLSLSSAVLVSISTNIITLDLRGHGCRAGGLSASNCAYVLSVSPTVSKAAIAILGIMSVATALLVAMVGKWRLGVHTNPWSMCTLASLSGNPDVRRLVVNAATGSNMKLMRDQLKHQDFKLDSFRGAGGNMEYGIVSLDRFNGAGLPSGYESEAVLLTSALAGKNASRRRHSSPFFMLGLIGRLISLLMLIGVMVLVLYYANTGGDTPFERFIDGDSFGVRFLFAGLGVILSLVWSSFFSAVAIVNSYQVLAEKPQQADHSILLAPPTNPFSGLWHAVRTRRVFLGVVSLASILSFSLSIFLSNIRFQVTQTFFVYQLSTWTSIGIMSFMTLVLLVSFFIKWPYMPVEPSSIAGAMYYVCNPSVIDKFEGLNMLGRKERDRIVTDMALLYELGEIVSAEGPSRIGLSTLNTQVYIP